MEKILRNKFTIALFVLPALFVYGFTVFVPVVWSLYYSLFSWDGITSMEFIGMQNYVRMFTDDRVFWDAFVNNLVYLAVIVSIQVGVGMLVAVLLTKIGFGREFFKTLYFTPAVITSVAIAQLFSKIYSFEPVGMINYVLHFLGLGHLQTAWLSSMDMALAAVSIPEGWRFIGLYMIILYAAFISIPKDMEEAGTIDGASGWKLFRYIKFPLIKPIFVITIVMATTGALKGFDIPFILTNGSPGHATEILTTYMYKTAFSSLQYGYGSAITVFIVLESLIAVLLIRKLTDDK